MSKQFEYRGYLGSAEVSIEDGVLFGKLLFIRDTITYEASSVSDLETAFKEAVDDYLDTCKELGDTPDVPCKGTFNVRVGPHIHRDIQLAARERGVGLNEFVCIALTDALHATRPVQHVHRHYVAMAGSEVTEWVSPGESGVEREIQRVAIAN